MNLCDGLFIPCGPRCQTVRFARTTKDLDLTVHDGTHLSKDAKERREQIRAMLQEAAAAPFDDYFEFLSRLLNNPARTKKAGTKLTK